MDVCKSSSAHSIRSIHGESYRNGKGIICLFFVCCRSVMAYKRRPITLPCALHMVSTTMAEIRTDCLRLLFLINREKRNVTLFLSLFLCSDAVFRVCGKVNNRRSRLSLWFCFAWCITIIYYYFYENVCARCDVYLNMLNACLRHKH